MYGFGILDIILLVIVPLALLYNHVNYYVERRKLGRVTLKLSKAHVQFALLMWCFLLVFNSYTFYSKYQTDLVRGFDRYETLVEVLYSYNPIFFLLPLFMLIPYSFSFVIKEKGLSFEHYNVEWHDIVDYKWKRKDKLSIFVNLKILKWSYKQGMHIYISKDQQDQVSTILREKLPNIII